MNNKRKFSLIGLLAAVAAAADLTTVELAAQAVAYTNVTIETVAEQGQLTNATLLIKDGKIAEVGNDVEIPEDARVISLEGSTIMPGIVDPYFVFKRSTQSQSGRTVTFNGRTFTIPGNQTFSTGSFDVIRDYFYPYQFDFRPSLRSGITTANLLSDGRGLSAFADFTALSNRSQYTSSDSDDGPPMLFRENGLLFVKATNQTAALDIIRKGLKGKKSTSRSRSKKAKTSATQSKSADENDSKSTSSVSNSSASSSSSTDSETHWAEVRSGKKPLLVNANNAATVAHLLQIIDKYPKAKLCVVATGPNVFESLDAIKKNKISLVIPPGIDTVPFSTRRMNVPKMIAEKEIPFALSFSLNQSQTRATLDDPMFPIGVLVKTGLSRDDALAALTISPAKILGIEETHGTIEKGKVANLLIFDGDPLLTGTSLKKVIVKGKLIHED